MTDKNIGFSLGLDFEKINRILSENPRKNQEAYERLAPIVKKKEEEFRAKIKSRTQSSILVDTKNAELTFDSIEFDVEEIENIYEEQVEFYYDACSFLCYNNITY
ncbi:hypothetical protein [Lactococcus lactis]|uniref:hypothetical protein n=1 Tax=Lactococcus lactis TaxID=1358 RepID=UPI001F5346F4|nr:hypothetical protein [Lactococcus lactis]MCI1071667.1 hypothetical protein [Lactococcus lactis]